MKKYFIHNGIEQQGPFDIEDLKGKGLTPKTQIWYDGLKTWIPAQNVTELHQVFQPTPPPFSSERIIETHERISTRPLISWPVRWLLIGICVFILGVVGVKIYENYNGDYSYKASLSSSSSSSSSSDEKANIRNNIMSYVTAKGSDYISNNMGGISDLKITISNSTDYLVDKVVVQITYYKTDGDVWRNKSFDFPLIQAQSSKTIRIPDTKRGTRVAYQISSVESEVLGLN